jgi:O-antigen/teichoic acid export membrane protein
MTQGQQVRDSVVYMVPALVGNVLPLVTLPLITRALSPAEYGMWALALAYGSFVIGLANFGLTLAYDRFFFEYQGTPKEPALLYSILAFVAGAFGLCMVGTWWMRDFLGHWLLGRTDAGGLLVLAAAGSGLSSLKWYFLAHLRNSGQARTYVWFTLDETVMAAVISVLLVVWFQTGVIGMAWGQFSAALLILTAVTVRFIRRMPPVFSGDILLEALRLGYPLTPRILLGAVGNNFDKYLLGLLASTGSVGVYAIGQKISHIVFTYMTALENVFGPQTYRYMFDQGEAGGVALGRYLTPFAYASAAIALAVALFSEEAVAMLAPPEYGAAVIVVNVLVLYYASMFFGKQPQLAYARQTHVLSVLTMVSLALNAGCTLLGVRMFGLWGAAGGMLTAGLLSVVLHNVVARRYYRIQWEWTRLSAIGGLLLIAAILPPAAIAADASYPIRLALKSVVITVFAVLGHWLGILSRERAVAVWGTVIQRFRPTAVSVEGTRP